MDTKDTKAKTRLVLGQILLASKEKTCLARVQVFSFVSLVSSVFEQRRE